MTILTNDITGLREQIKDNATVIWPGNAIILLIQRQQKKYQAVVMRTEEGWNEEILAVGAGRETIYEAYDVLLYMLSCRVTMELQARKDKIAHARMLDPPPNVERQQG